VYSAKLGMDAVDTIWVAGNASSSKHTGVVVGLISHSEVVTSKGGGFGLRGGWGSRCVSG